MRKLYSAVFPMMLASSGLMTTEAVSQSFTGKDFSDNCVVSRDLPTLTEINRSLHGEVPTKVGPQVPDLIVSPEGEKKPYFQAGEHWYLWIIGLPPICDSYEDVATDIVYGENNEIYIKNVISGFPTGTYIAGTLSGETATFSFPQTVYYEKENGEIHVYSVDRLEFEEIDSDTGEGTFRPAEERTVEFSVTDGGITMEESDGKWLLGITNDTGGWLGLGDYDITFTPNNYQPIQTPEGLAAETWQFISDYTGHEVSVGFDGQYVYIKGVFPNLPESWIKARVEGDKIIFDEAQYLGVYEDRQSTAFAIPGRKAISETGRTVYSLAEQTVFEYDAADCSMSATDGIVINANTERVYFHQYFGAPTIHKEKPGHSLVPQDIVPVAYVPYNENYRAGGYQFYVPTLSVDNFLLDKDKIYWELYTDGEPYVFEPYLYPVFSKDTAQVPFHVDSPDIQSGGAPLHELHFFFQEECALGVRTLYKVSDDEIYYSNYVVYDPNDSGIGIIDDDNTDEATVYYDFLGRRIANPEKGKMYIVSKGAVWSKAIYR